MTALLWPSLDDHVIKVLVPPQPFLDFGLEKLHAVSAFIDEMTRMYNNVTWVMNIEKVKSGEAYIDLRRHFFPNFRLTLQVYVTELGELMEVCWELSFYEKKVDERWASVREMRFGKREERYVEREMSFTRNKFGKGAKDLQWSEHPLKASVFINTSLLLLEIISCALETSVRGLYDLL
jgi:hypothetical protein